MVKPEDKRFWLINSDNSLNDTAIINDLRMGVNEALRFDNLMCSYEVRFEINGEPDSSRQPAHMIIHLAWGDAGFYNAHHDGNFAETEVFFYSYARVESSCTNGSKYSFLNHKITMELDIYEDKEIDKKLSVERKRDVYDKLDTFLTEYFLRYSNRYIIGCTYN